MRDERFTGAKLDPDVLERQLEIRLDRQLILDREPDAPRLAVVMSEAVVRRRIGDADTMVGQLIHLLEKAQRPDIAIRVMPLDVEEHGGLTTGPFPCWTSRREAR